MFELGTIDVVLGYTWLEKLEETRINWGLHIMKFQVHDKWVTISGDPTLGVTEFYGEAGREGRSDLLIGVAGSV